MTKHSNQGNQGSLEEGHNVYAEKKGKSGCFGWKSLISIIVTILAGIFAVVKYAVKGMRTAHIPQQNNPPHLVHQNTDLRQYILANNTWPY